ncbi:MAG: RNA-directed DNA polymerase [Nanoarchaeota archaeon]
MPLGNLTSQFFANIYLNELDQFIKHELRAKYYIRYVDDFTVLHSSRSQLQEWKERINIFLKERLKIELHAGKSKIISLGKPIAFLGIKIFYHYKLLKRFNRRNVQRRVHKLYQKYADKDLTYDQVYESMQGTCAHMKHANTYRLRVKILKMLKTKFPEEISTAEVNSYIKSMKRQHLLLQYSL